MTDQKYAFQQIQALLSDIQKTHFLEPEKEKHLSDALLELSEQHNHLYGQALAHVYIANYYSVNPDMEKFNFHIHKACEIAHNKEFLDILTDCYKLEGLRCLELCDDISAFTWFLKGSETALLIGYHRSCCIFYNNIAEIFLQNEAYDEAEAYYHKSLHFLENVEQQGILVYKEMTLINLFELACMQNQIKKAQKYLDMCFEINCQQSMLPQLLKMSQIRFFLLTRKEQQALSEIECLIAYFNQIENSYSLMPVYKFFMNILLLTPYEKHISWCLNKLLQYQDQANNEDNLKIQSFYIQYCEKFEKEDPTAYEKFYELTMKIESTNRAMSEKSLKNLVSLNSANQSHRNIIDRQEELRAVVDLDELTGLYSRRSYSRTISKYLKNASISTLGFIMIDVDYFKQYNDRYGHLQGDSVLKSVSACLKKHLPTNCIAARYGGDEFSCFLPNLPQVKIRAFIKSVIHDLEQLSIEHLDSKAANYVTLSIGSVNCTRTDSLTENELIKKADQALYHTKANGRNGFSFY